MANEPLTPFAPPASVSALLPQGLSTGLAIEWLLYIVFAFWAVYTIVAIYHWLRYSHASWVAFPTIALHLFVSVALMVYALSGTFIVHV